MKKLFTTFPLLVLLLSTLPLTANGTDPTILFTDNINATGISTEITAMEAELLAQINSATSSIDVAIYGFNRDSIRDALIAAHNRGVTVRVVTDDEVSEDSDTYRPYYDALANVGIPIVDDARPSDIMHNKFFIFDGGTVWTGSTNITDNGFTKNHNNAILFSSNDPVTIFSAQFEQMFIDGNFSTAKSPSPTTSTIYKGMPLEIYFSPKDDALAEVIAEVNAAAESIYFSIFYLTSDALRDALIAAHNRGVTIRGVWDLLGASNAYSDDEALCNAGINIKIEEYTGKMHNKFMIIDVNGDSPRTITGSMNWSTNGDERNDENTIILHDAETAVSFKGFWDTLYDSLDADTLCTPEPSHFVFLPLLIAPGSPSPDPGTAVIHITTILYNPDGDDALTIEKDRLFANLSF